VCGAVNSNRVTYCHRCLKRKPAKRKPRHMAALEITYEQYVELNGGEHCAICGRGPGSRRLDRDHDHLTGKPRGLLCHRDNRQLPSWVTPDWLRAAAAYLEERS
jgi:hypothetical protein